MKGWKWKDENVAASAIPQRATWTKACAMENDIS